MRSVVQSRRYLGRLASMTAARSRRAARGCGVAAELIECRQRAIRGWLRRIDGHDALQGLNRAGDVALSLPADAQQKPVLWMRPLLN